jgi:membrane protease YdiL (CAAX protease family)
VDSSSIKPNIANLLHLILFLLVPIFWLFVIVTFQLPLPAWYLILAQIAVSIYFFIARRRLFNPSLFFILLLITSYIPLPEGIWVINILIAVIALIGLIHIIPPLKKVAIRFPWGHFDRQIILYSILVIIISVIALIVWKSLAKPDIRALMDTALDIDPKYILPAIIIFPIFNAIAEELMFRWILWDGLTELVRSSATVIIIQSLIFGLSHYNGFPNGWLGVGMAAFYGLMLGYIRYRSKGLLPPIFTHIFADITIILIVFINAGII